MVLVCFSLWAVNVALISFAHCYRPLTLTFTHCYHPLTATKHLVAITLNSQLNWTVNKCLVEHLCLCSCWYSECEIFIFSLDLKKKASSCPPAHACRSAYSKADGSGSIQKQMDSDPFKSSWIRIHSTGRWIPTQDLPLQKWLFLPPF